jgi:hypothetical protein
MSNDRRTTGRIDITTLQREVAGGLSIHSGSLFDTNRLMRACGDAGIGAGFLSGRATGIQDSKLRTPMLELDGTATPIEAEGDLSNALSRTRKHTNRRAGGHLIHRNSRWAYQGYKSRFAGGAGDVCPVECL